MLTLREGTVIGAGGGVAVVSDVFSFHSDGHEDAKLGSNTDPLAPNRLLNDPSGSIDAQGEWERV